MECFLKPGVHGVVIDDDLALIDLNADSYLCLSGGVASVLGSRDGALVLGGAGTSVIVDAGLTSGASSPQSKRTPPLPESTIIYEPPERLSPRQILKALQAVHDVRCALRQPGLYPILAVAADRSVATDREAAVKAARDFWRLAPWLPLEGECLVRSAMLIGFLRRSGLSAEWVFGVRLWPFSAHCWVQVGDTCLNDDVERLAAYTPIYCR